MILVCAATGRVGSRVVERLLPKLDKNAVVAGVRDPRAGGRPGAAGVSTRLVDYDDPAGLDAAFLGVQRLVFIPSFADTEQRTAQGLNVIAAAEKAGVGQLLFVGIMDTRSDSPLPFAHAYGAIERALRESSLNWTVLRTSMYTDNLEEQYPMWLERGELVTCAGDGKISYVSRDDIAASIVGVLTASIELHGKTVYTLTGPAALSYDEVGAIVNEVFAAHIHVKHVTLEEFTAGLREIWGLAYDGVDHVARVTPLFQQVFREGMMSEVTRHVEQLSGRAPESVEHWLRRHGGTAA